GTQNSYLWLNPELWPPSPAEPRTLNPENSAMSRPCTICNHPQRSAIDRALASGDPYRKVALRYGISTATVSRHRTAHLADRLARAQLRAASEQRADDQRLLAERDSRQAAEAAFDLDVLNELQRCVQRLIRLMDACEQYLRDPEDPE